MGNKKSTALLIGIMAVVVGFVTGTTIFLLYQVALREHSDRLLGSVGSISRVLQNAQELSPAFRGQGDPLARLRATLKLARGAQVNFAAYGKTGELQIGYRNAENGECWVFPAGRGFADPTPLLCDDNGRTPMAQALMGQSGVIISSDMNGERVVAAYQPLGKTGFGVMAKIDLAELQAPFIRAGLVALFFALAAVALGAVLFFRVTSPLLRRLEKSESRYREVVASTSDWIWETDEHLRFTHYSEQLEAVIGEAAQETLGMTRFELKPPGDNPEKWAGHMADLLARRPFRDFEYAFATKGGGEIVTRTSGAPFFDKAGVFRGYRGTGRDVTGLVEAQQELRGRLALWQAFKEAANENLSLFDSELRLLDVNGNALRRFGLKKEDIIGKRLEEITTHPETLARMAEYRGVLQTGQPITRAGPVVHAELGERFYEFRVFPVGTGLGVVSNDVTERKKMEVMKNDFISVVSHELRTPLTAIMSTLQILQEGMAGELTERGAEIVRIGTNNAERLLVLINDILDVEQVGSGRMAFHVRPLRLQTLAAQAVEANRPFGSPEGIEIELATENYDGMVLGDYDRLMQVMTNLLSNAVKFSPRDGRVQVGIEGENGRVRVAVADAGVGIPEEFRELVFEKFSQANRSAPRPHRGAGLGLTICKTIVEKHQGRIYFQPTPGGGTTFIFELPEWKGGGTPLSQPS